MDLGTSYAYLEVNLKTHLQNLANMQAVCKRKIIPVTKGNAWGEGTVEVSRNLVENGGYDTIAVANVTEGKKLREAGLNDTTIMILSGTPLHVLPYVVKYNLLMMVYNKETVDALSEEVKKAGLSSFPIQVKIDTGLHRIGVAPDKAEELVKYILAKGNLSIVGFCSHYADSYDINSAKTPEQYRIFKETVLKIKALGVDPKYISIGCSPNVDFPDEDICTHVRVGWGFVAYTPYGDFKEFHGNKLPISLRAFITDMHDIKKGDTLGYSSVIADTDKKVATISIGYADGLYRQSALHGGPLLIRGKEAHYLDLCMDQTVIDVTGIDCKVGDEVTIFGKDRYSDRVLTTTELAAHSDGNSTILHVYLNDRVARVYINE